MYDLDIGLLNSLISLTSCQPQIGGYETVNSGRDGYCVCKLYYLVYALQVIRNEALLLLTHLTREAEVRPPGYICNCSFSSALS